MDIVNKNIDLLEKSFDSDPVSSHREIEMVKDYIHGHFGEEISAQQLADMVYLAPSYLSSLFKKETGQNLSKYIKQYRMEKAHTFEQKNKSIVCRELLGLSVKEQSPVPEARTQEYYKKRPCKELIGMAAQILENYINEHPYKNYNI